MTLANQFLVSVSVDICLTDQTNCDLHLNILDNHPFSKQICNFTSGFVINGIIHLFISYENQLLFNLLFSYVA